MGPPCGETPKDQGDKKLHSAEAIEGRKRFMSGARRKRIERPGVERSREQRQYCSRGGY